MSAASGWAGAGGCAHDEDLAALEAMHAQTLEWMRADARPRVLIAPEGVEAAIVAYAHRKAGWETTEGREALARHGLDLPTAVAAGLGRLVVQTDGDGYWSPSTAELGGRALWTLPMPEASAGWAEDVLAFDPDDPLDGFRLRGACPVLGWAGWWEARAPWINADGHCRETILLHSDPLSWLRAGRVGWVIVDWRGLEARHFAGAKRVICRGRRDFALRVSDRLAELWQAARPPRRPSVLRSRAVDG